MGKALAGIRVLDLTEGVAGPYASSLLGDMGADVIKVERPAGDWGRGSGAVVAPGISTGFVAVNRNKRNLGLDLTQPGARPVIQRLLARSDVIISNYRTGVMDRLGLGYDACSHINPQILYCTISAFGQQGPYAAQPASDTVMQAMSGIMAVTGEPDGPPLRVSFPLIDIMAATMAVQGVLQGLIARMRGHQGPWRVDVSLLNAAMALQAMLFARYALTGHLPRRHGNQNPSLAPAGAFRTRDGRYLAVAVLRASHWEKFCYAVGRPDLLADERFTDNARRLQNRAALNAVLEPVFLSKTRAEWLRLLTEADVLCAPVNDFADVLADPGLAAALSLLPYRLDGQEAPIVGNPVAINGHFPELVHAPAAPGAHTAAILGELGYSEAEIQGLYEQGIVF